MGDEKTDLVLLCVLEEFADVVAGQNAGLKGAMSSRTPASALATYGDDVEDAHFRDEER